MTKDMFITKVIQALQAREDVDRVVHIPSSNLFVTMTNGDVFPIIIGQKRKR
jgi:hypothetical protein